MTKVSIVIVCMNNLKNLYPCLKSIREYTSVEYEVLVVAYLFSRENLEKVKREFSWVTFIESNEIRGFSENNNLALQQAKGEYCFVLNDDTEMRSPVVDELVRTIESLPDEVAIVSPVTTYPDGRVQICGRPEASWKTYIAGIFHLLPKGKGRYVNGNGVFQTYNILGAAFLIKTEVFRTVGWFDEIYFFAPEDIALSTLLNRQGYKCYVNADVKIIHYEGLTSKSLSMVRTATRPASERGSLIFYSNGNAAKMLLLRCLLMVSLCMRFVFHGIKSLIYKRPNYDYVLWLCDLNCIQTCFSSKTPKEIFTKYFKKIKK